MEQSQNVEKVNGLIKRTFGNNYKSDYISKKGIWNIPQEIGKPNEIWKEGILTYVYIGKFNSGSELEIHSRRYRRKARRFAGLCKRDLGREIQIIFEK